MELLISGLLFGLTIGWYFTKYTKDQKIRELEELLIEQDNLVKMQSMYIEQEGRRYNGKSKGKSIHEV